MKQTSLVQTLVIGGVLLSVRWASAFTLGIALDDFLTQFETAVVGLGLIVGLVGLLGWVGSLFDNPFSHILSGSPAFLLKAGLLGGGTTILGAMGLVSGALVP